MVLYLGTSASSKKQPPFEQLLYTKTFDHKDMVYQELRGMQSLNLTTVQISSVLDKITLCKETASINTAFRRELEFLSVGWMTCDFTFFSTVFWSYWEYRLMIMKGSVQWNPIYQAGLELGIECWNHFSQQIANNTNKLNLVKELFFNIRLHPLHRLTNNSHNHKHHHTRGAIENSTKSDSFKLALFFQ